MNFIREAAEKVRAAFYSHVRPELKALSERPKRITWAEYEGITANSYERRLLNENLDDEALCKLYELCAKNSRRPLLRFELADHYGDMIERELAPLLVARLRAERLRSAELRDALRRLRAILDTWHEGDDITARGRASRILKGVRSFVHHLEVLP